LTNRHPTHKLKLFISIQPILTLLQMLWAVRTTSQIATMMALTNWAREVVSIIYQTAFQWWIQAANTSIIRHRSAVFTFVMAVISMVLATLTRAMCAW